MSQAKRPLTPDTSSSSLTRTPRSVRFKPNLVEKRVYDPESRTHGLYRIHDGDADDDNEDTEDEENDIMEEGEEGGIGKGRERGKKRNEAVLCLHGPNGANLAAAYYEPDSGKMQVLEDTKDTVGWDLATLVMEQLSPNRIIMSSRTQDSLVDKIDEYCLQHNINAEIRPSKKSDRADAINQLSNLRLLGFDDDNPNSDELPSTAASSELEDDDPLAKYRTDDMQYAGMGRVRLSLVKLGCWVNVDAPLAIEAIGGLLTYFKNVITQETLPGEDVSVDVKSIESMQLDQHMFINHDALTSLSIFDYDQAAQAGSERNKGLSSIYSLLRTTVTPLGHKLLRMWLLRPLVNINSINARHDAVSAFLREENRPIAEEIVKALRKVKNMPLHIKRICRGKGGVKEWRALVDALIAAIEVRELIINMPDAKKLEIGIKVYHMFSPTMQEFQRQATEIIDFDTSNAEKRVCVRPGVDEVLDGLRSEYDGMSQILELVAQKVRETIDSRYPIDLNVVYFGQIGFLVSVELLGEGFQAPKDWEVRFSSDSVWYFKTKHIQRLDEEFGDIETAIAGREIEIVQELVEQMQGLEAEVSGAMDIIAEVDCLLALAGAAADYRLTRPTMIEEPVLEIHGGRHLLQELYVQTYIMNDTLVAGGVQTGIDSMIIVTGANGSGKSAYGRQVALIVFLAQIGSFVPAESAIIGVVDKIFTRMQTKESASKNASAFMIDLTQVSLALRGATSSSLVVLDEFGKGTNPADGAGLLAGVIEHFLNGPCPRTIILTHFHELFTEQFVDDQLPIKHCHMKTELLEGSKDLVYLYRLTPGKSLSSNAAECALANGIPREVVERAKEVSGHLARFEISKIHDVPLTPKDIRELEQAEDLARRFLEWEIDETKEDVMEVLKDMLDAALDPDSDDEEWKDRKERKKEQEGKIAIEDIIKEEVESVSGHPTIIEVD